MTKNIGVGRAEAPFQVGCLPAAVAVHVGSSSTLPPLAFDVAHNKLRWEQTSTCSEQDGAWVIPGEDSLHADALDHGMCSIMQELFKKRWLDASSAKKVKLGIEFSAVWRPSVFSRLKDVFQSQGNSVVFNCSADAMPRFEAQMRSKREIEYLRLAANVLAVGMHATRQRLDINRTELDLYGTHVHQMVIAGGEIPWKSPGTIKVNPLQAYEIPGRTEVRPGDMVFVSSSGVFEGQYVSACRAFYLQVNCGIILFEFVLLFGRIGYRFCVSDMLLFVCHR
jgi:hypothetical protein